MSSSPCPEIAPYLSERYGLLNIRYWGTVSLRKAMEDASAFDDMPSWHPAHLKAGIRSVRGHTPAGEVQMAYPGAPAQDPFLDVWVVTSHDNLAALEEVRLRLRPSFPAASESEMHAWRERTAAFRADDLRSVMTPGETTPLVTRQAARP